MMGRFGWCAKPLSPLLNAVMNTFMLLPGIKPAVNRFANVWSAAG